MPSHAWPNQFTLIYGPNISGSYPILFFIASDFMFTTTELYFHFGPVASFSLEILVIALHSSPVAYWTLSILGRITFQCHIFLLSHTVHGVLLAIILEWFAISSSSEPCFVRTLHYDSSVLGGPAWHVS